MAPRLGTPGPGHFTKQRRDRRRPAAHARAPQDSGGRHVAKGGRAHDALCMLLLVNPTLRRAVVIATVALRFERLCHELLPRAHRARTRERRARPPSPRAGRARRPAGPQQAVQMRLLGPPRPVAGEPPSSECLGRLRAHRGPPLGHAGASARVRRARDAAAAASFPLTRFSPFASSLSKSTYFCKRL